MNPRRTVVALLAVACLTASARAAVFQYAQPVGEGKKAGQALLWIPPEAPCVRGVVLAGQTLMEKHFVSDPAIRKACADQQIALLFSTRGLGSLDIPALLGAFAKQSGYTELPNAALMFVGHSAGGPPARDLATKYADRCFGLIQYRGGGPGDGGGLPAGIPALMMVGQFDEFWGTMRQADGSESWQKLLGHMANYRGKDPANLGSIAVEPGAGHFAFSDRNGKLAAEFIRSAAEVRIPEMNEYPKGGQHVKLKTVDYKDGYLTPLEITEASKHEPVQAGKFDGDASEMAWHASKEMAQDVLDYHAGGFGKKDQFIEWKDRYWVDAGTRFFFLGMTWVDDGQTFQVHPAYAQAYPKQHKGNGPRWLQAGEPVGNSGTPIKVRPVAGPIEAVGDHKFRIRYSNLNPAGDRARTTFLAYSEGNKEYRYTEIVGMMPRGFRGLNKGKAQSITFAQPGDVAVGSGPIQLIATSDAGLPVEFYVAHGPAKVVDGKLVLTDVPGRATFPIEVEVVATQFGRGLDPKVKTADPVSRTLKITKQK